MRFSRLKSSPGKRSCQPSPRLACNVLNVWHGERIMNHPLPFIGGSAPRGKAAMLQPRPAVSDIYRVPARKNAVPPRVNGKRVQS